MIRAYNRLLRERPFAVNSAQGAVLGAVGDLVAQRLQHGAITDWQQCGRAAGFGAALSGLFVPAFYRRLDAVWPGTSPRAVVSKSVSDIAVQGVGGNAAAIAARGAPAAEVWRAMPEVLVADCCVWLPYNLVAFRLIPLHVRPTTTALMTLGFNTYLSHVAVRARGQEAFARPEGQL